jgi:hypothetical protein
MLWHCVDVLMQRQKRVSSAKLEEKEVLLVTW